ncbi:unnamed protein product [Hymenolepis diminuta]|uniref:UBX domain-containing protein n=1 Tax=Hymenolepis diminuta TaxID=6216 RepID=A0A158QFH4_HYMDI|nr:unnamed protein product [Hymenolepis diminuta]
MFKIQRDLAEDILQQFNFDIEAAANFFLSGPSNEDVEMIDVSSNEPPPPLPPKSHKRRLSFYINFHTDEDKLNMLNFHLDDVPENRTVGDLKDLLINKYRDELASLAAKMGMCTEVDSMKKFMRFEGMQNPSGLNDSATLKSLHLPINNTWASYFKKRTRLRRPSSDGSIKSMSYNIKIRLISNHSNGESNFHHSKGGNKLIPLLGITDVTSLAELRRMAAQEAKVSVSSLRWSAKSPKNSNLERLVVDLNHITMDNTLLHYKLKSDQVYIFDVSTIPLPSTSKPSGSQIFSSHKGSRPYRLTKRPVVIDDDDDGDTLDQQEIDDDEEDYPVYEISDDEEPGLRAATESTNPQNLPLIPANLITNPVKALENFFVVFIQRYCNEADSSLPSFCLQTFSEAFAQSVGIQKAYERKPMLIYLHHDRSIASNIFCTKILCSDSMSAFLEENNLQIWPWDVTLESGREALLSWLEPRLSNVASEIEHMEGLENYPLLIMICKVAGAYEIAAILTGHGIFHIPISSVFADTSSHGIGDNDDDNDSFPPLLETSNIGASSSRNRRSRGGLNAQIVVSQLREKLQLYSHLLAPEILADSERLARENMREEQDRAYKESLRQDRLKKEAKEKELAELAAKEAEAQRIAEEIERTALEKQKLAAKSLPKEPSQGTPGIATLRFRLPQTNPQPPALDRIPEESRPQIANGFIVRRFNGTDTLKDVKNFMEFLGYGVLDFKLLRTYPRVDLTSNDESDNTSMVDLKLVPQETLNLEKR